MRLKTSVGNFTDGKLLMISLLSRDDGRVGSQREVDSRVGDQIRLELCQVHVQGTIKSERSRDGGHDLTDDSVKVRVAGTLNVEVSTADVVDGLVVDHEGTVRVFQGSVGG